MPYDFSVIGMEEKLVGRIFTILVLTEQNSWVTIIAFFLVAYAFTWIFHGLIILLHLPFRRITKSAAQVLYVLGLGGPSGCCSFAGLSVLWASWRYRSAKWCVELENWVNLVPLCYCTYRNHIPSERSCP